MESVLGLYFASSASSAVRVLQAHSRRGLRGARANNSS